MINLENKIISSDTRFEGKIFNVRIDRVILPDQSESSREIIEHAGGATIIPVTADNKIIMVKQFRTAAGEILLELPAGKLEKGEEPENCVNRELLEETGYRARKIKKLFSFYTTPGYSSELLHLFLGEDLQYFEKNPDKGEFLETVIIAKNEIMDLINSGKIKDSKTIIGLLYLLRGEDEC